MQSRQDQKKMNEAFQEYKRRVDEARKAGTEIEVILDDVEVPFEVHSMIFEPYNRAKAKTDTRRAVDDYERGEENEDM